MDNIVFMIGEKNSGRIFNAHNSRFANKITFGSFYPSKIDCQYILDNIIGDSRQQRYSVIEAEVLRFDGKELIVAYDNNFSEIQPY